MKKFVQNFLLFIKVIILLGIISLFIALCIFTVGNKDKDEVKDQKSDKKIEESKDEKREYSYTIENDKLFITLNNKILNEVPIKLNNILGLDKSTNEIDKKLYQIDDNKIIFIAKENSDVSLIISDDFGYTWHSEKLNLEDSDIAVPMYLHFFSKDSAILVLSCDVAMRKTMAKIALTNNGAKSWQTSNLGNDGYITISIDSDIEFFSIDLGFISNPLNGGDSAELYMIENQATSFTKVNLEEQFVKSGNENVYLNWKDIYDYIQLPKLEDGKLKLTVTQGNDGDYMGGKISAKYESTDMGKTWQFVEEYIPNN